MPGNDSHYPADWRAIAEKDWKRAQSLLGEDPELAGFCLQQAVEKFLKAFLLSKGWQLRRIHNLEALLDEAIKYDDSLEVFRSPCQTITAFYFVERYPFTMQASIGRDDVEEAISAAKDLINKIRNV
jgi:HEPN domain-containing protein